MLRGDALAVVPEARETAKRADEKSSALNIYVGGNKEKQNRLKSS